MTKKICINIISLIFYTFSPTAYQLFDPRKNEFRKCVFDLKIKFENFLFEEVVQSSEKMEICLR